VQSYGEFRRFPRICAKSSPSCCDSPRQLRQSCRKQREYCREIEKNGAPLLSDITEQFRWSRPLHADVGEELLASVLQACAKDIDGIVDNQETVVIALAEVDGDRGILLVVALQVELLLWGELAVCLQAIT